MKLSNELLKKAKQCKSAEEIATLAKDNGVDLSENEAQEAFNYLNKSGELSDNELNNVAGGALHGSCDMSGATPKYKVGEHVKYKYYFSSASNGDYTGYIQAISDKREGNLFDEWIYSISDDHPCSSDKEVYEHQIYGQV